MEISPCHEEALKKIDQLLNEIDHISKQVTNIVYKYNYCYETLIIKLLTVHHTNKEIHNRQTILNSPVPKIKLDKIKNAIRSINSLIINKSKPYVSKYLQENNILFQKDSIHFQGSGGNGYVFSFTTIAGKRKAIKFIIIKNSTAANARCVRISDSALEMQQLDDCIISNYIKYPVTEAVAIAIHIINQYLDKQRILRDPFSCNIRTNGDVTIGVDYDYLTHRDSFESQNALHDKNIDYFTGKYYKYYLNNPNNPDTEIVVDTLTVLRLIDLLCKKIQIFINKLKNQLSLFNITNLEGVKSFNLYALKLLLFDEQAQKHVATASYREILNGAYTYANKLEKVYYNTYYKDHYILKFLTSANGCLPKYHTNNIDASREYYRQDFIATQQHNWVAGKEKKRTATRTKSASF